MAVAGIMVLVLIAFAAILGLMIVAGVVLGVAFSQKRLHQANVRAINKEFGLDKRFQHLYD